MSAGPVGAIVAPNQASITDLLAQLDKMIGGGKTTSSSTTGPDQGALDQENLMLQKIFADINPDSLDAMVGNILERAKQTFGPAAISANAGGIRAYSDTVLESLRNEAMARATGEAAQAKIDAINKANATAATLVNSRMNASKNTQQTSKTGPSTLGKGAGLLSLGSAGMNIYKKLKDLYQPNALPGDELASGGEGFINDAENYASTDGGGGGITSVEAGSGGAGTVASSGSSTIVPPSSGFGTDTSPFLSAESMQEQTTLAEQGTQGMGELSEVPMLSLPSEAEMTVLNQQAAQAFEGSGELSEIPALGGGSLDQAIASLPGAEEMAGLSDLASQGLEGAGELSELPVLGAQASPGATGTGGTEGLTAEPTEIAGATAVGAGAIDVTSGAGSKILLDSGQTITSQGASTVPGTDTIQFASQGSGGAELSALDTEANLGLEGAGELSEVPALTGSTAAGGATATGTSGAAAAGGEETAATLGAEEGAGSAIGAASIPLAMIYTAFDFMNGSHNMLNAMEDLFGDSKESSPEWEAIMAGGAPNPNAWMSGPGQEALQQSLQMAQEYAADPEAYAIKYGLNNPDTSDTEDDTKTVDTGGYRTGAYGTISKE
jgi:hypothetical protein